MARKAVEKPKYREKEPKRKLLKKIASPLKQNISLRCTSVKQKSQKLPRGRKLCHNCRALLYIHQAICPNCKEVHTMKRSKEEILKCLGKNQPKALRGILENNQFNECKLNNVSFHYPTTQLIPLQQRRTSSPLENDNSSVWKEIQIGPNCPYTLYHSRNPKICLTAFQSDILFIETVPGSKRQTKSKPSFYQQITIKSFNLGQYHKIGAYYTADSYMCYFSAKKKSVAYKILIKEDILMMKSFANRVALLTGQGEILLIVPPKEMDIPMVSVAEQVPCFSPKDLVNIREQNAYFTSMQWLTRGSKQDQNRLVVGTLSGELLLYDIGPGNTVFLYRVFYNAHFQHVTVIAECPTSSLDKGTIFASGSYDGTVSVWNPDMPQSIFSAEISSRKIVSLIWDSGAKYLFVIRDQGQQSCIMICFYSVNRTEVSLCLSTQAQLRAVKTPNISYIASHDSSSKILSLIDTVECQILFMTMEELRKNSLKKKKNNDGKKDRSFHYKIKLTTNPIVIPDKLEKRKSNSKSKQKNNTISKMVSESHINDGDLAETKPISQQFKGFPIVSDFVNICVEQKNEKINYLYGCTYNGFIFSFRLSPKELTKI